MKRAFLPSAAGIAVLALLVPLATATHRPGHKANDANPDLTIIVEPKPQIWPRLVTVAGQLKVADSAGKTIEVQANPHPYTGQPKPVGTTTTNSDGDYTFSYQLAEHTNFRVATEGVDPEEVSGVVNARSRMKVTRSASDRTPADGQTITFSGRVGPAHEGMLVMLQRRRPSGTWRTLANAQLGEMLSDGTSAYSTEVEIKRDGVWRARVKGDENHRGNKSRRIRIDVQ
jgi:hypothetical protein